MIEENEKSVPLIESIKQRIKYLEVNDPSNVALKLLKQQIQNDVS